MSERPTPDRSLLESFKDSCRESFGDVLGDLLAERKITQLELADVTGWSKSTVNAWISGERMPRHIADLKAVAEALNCSEQERRRLLQAYGCDQLRASGFDCSGELFH